ncbi:Lipid A export ATP-binding/permease protein MsbA [Chitinispirillum alkaliphilum]|nr:Lipid A export ATP-binding/permease protein MsbA [Chitinispirillum alkaliphilum]
MRHTVSGTEEKIPSALQSLVNGRGIIYYQKSDLDSSRKFGASYLVLTERSLLTVCSGNITAEYPLDQICDIRIDELVGGGRLSVVLKEGTYHLIYYSNHKVPHFADASKYIMDYVNGIATEHPEEQMKTFCAKCQSPMPDPKSNCPRCVPRLKVFSRIMSLSSPYKGKVIALMIVTALGVLFQVLPPYITKKIVDEVIEGGDTGRLYLYTGAMISAGLLYFLMRLINIHLTSWISARIVGDLRSRLHSVLQYLKLKFFAKREPGEIVGRVMHDTSELLQFLVEGVPYLLINTISFFVVAFILIRINWVLALFIFLPVPLLVFGSGWFWKKLHPLFLRQGTVIGHMHSVLNESFYGLRVIKAFSQEKRRIGMFDSVNQRLAKTEMKTFRIFGSFNEFMFAIMALGVALVWFFAVHMIVGENSNMTLGDLLAFVGYIWLFYGPLQYFSVILNWMTHAFSGAERIFEIIDSSPESHDHPEAVTLPQIKGHIEFRDVHFSYERGKQVIKGINLDIKPGEVIGLVGRSGAGKSTIINLLSRFYEPDSGEVFLDGLPVEKIKLEQLRKSMGIVLQDPFLFNTTIAENIAYGLHDVSFKDVVEAARAAHAHEFIIKKPDGYDTVVGNGTGGLSGGERQRIAIARAILHNPPILILDEATSAVDATTEMKIQEAISGLVKGRTTIAIAHRLSTLRNADRLVVIDNGVIVEIGTHDELMNRGGIYAQMADSYSKMNTLQSVVWGG